MRRDVEFKSSGLTLRGWFYEPVATPAPAVVMSHGFSAVKEQGLDVFAERFAAAGFAVLVFDHRCLGASDGSERGRIVAQEQHDDTRAALDWISTQPSVDPARIGLWGSSYSGGHAIVVGALDPRVKVVVAQAPALDVAGSLRALAGPEGFAGYLGLLAQDHAARNAGESGGQIPVVAPDGEPAVLSTPDSFAWFTASAATAPAWLNVTSLESVARMVEYKPIAFVDLVAPKPLLLIAEIDDALIPIAQVREAFARAGEPKKLIELSGGHFDVYPGSRDHDAAATAATDWFVTHLR